MPDGDISLLAPSGVSKRPTLGQLRASSAFPDRSNERGAPLLNPWDVNDPRAARGRD
jgi:hypothetical protein